MSEIVRCLHRGLAGATFSGADAAGWAARAVGNALVERRRLDLVRRIQDSGGDLVVVVTESQPCKVRTAWGGRTLSLSGFSTEPSLAVCAPTRAVPRELSMFTTNIQLRQDQEMSRVEVASIKPQLKAADGQG